MDDLDKTVLIESQYTSYQGTGTLSGELQDFIRLSGCSVPCPLRKNCDQPESLQKGSNKKTIQDIIDDMDTDWLHITGGEPAERPEMVNLCRAAIRLGKRVQVQTSGTIDIEWGCDPFVSVSPKLDHIKNVKESEIVIVAASWMTEKRAIGIIKGRSCPVFVIPESKNGEFSNDAMFKLLDSLHRSGIKARAGLQSHLVWNIS